MSTEAIGSNSQEGVYHLTAPFVYPNSSKNAYEVRINGHTPQDVEQGQKATTWKDFKQNIVDEKLYHQENFTPTEALGLPTPGLEQPDVIYDPSNQTKASDAVSGFSASELSKTDIVNGAIQRGYSPKHALTMAMANAAYSSCVGELGADVVDTLSNYDVHGDGNVLNTQTSYKGQAKVDQIEDEVSGQWQNLKAGWEQYGTPHSHWES